MYRWFCFIIVHYTNNTIFFSLKNGNRSKIHFDPYYSWVATMISLVCILPDRLSLDLHIYYMYREMNLYGK